MSANGVAKVNVCVEHYLGIFFFGVCLPVKNEDGNPYSNSGGSKKNSGKNNNDQIKKLHNTCIYLRDGVSA